MTPNLHVDPAVPRAVAAALGATLPVLRAAALDDADLAALAGLPGGAALVAEHDRLADALGRRLRDLVDVVDGLGAAADGIAAAERQAVAALWVAAR